MKKIFGFVIAIISGFLAGVLLVSKLLDDEKEKWHQLSDKHQSIMILLNQWVQNKQAGKNVLSYFTDRDIKKIAIYGTGVLGETLYNELKESEVEVKYCIDRNNNSQIDGIEALSPDSQFDEVDMIVVTAITFFDDIFDMLENKVDCPIISLEDIIYMM